jgi:hypothetical protein
VLAFFVVPINSDPEVLPTDKYAANRAAPFLHLPDFLLAFDLCVLASKT